MYLLEGKTSEGTVQIRIQRYGLAEAFRLYRSEYSRLDANNLLPAKPKAEGRPA